jgi:PDZ domain-containing secreted protein
MSRVFLSLTAALFLVVSPAALRADDEKKTDLQTTVKEGTEFALTAAEVIPANMPNEQGFRVAMVKPGKAGPKVKMPAQAYGLNVVAKPIKGGLEVTDIPEGSALLQMRTDTAKSDNPGVAMMEVGDIITHVNGNEVASVEELIFALSTAKDKDDVQLVVKDKNSGNAIVLYATAVKK